MSEFPQTPTSLLTRIAAEKSGENDEAAWAEFFEIYEPAMRGFIERRYAGGAADDIVQGVFVKLVAILRERKYDRTRGSFRAYLATLLYRELIGFLRKETARGAGCHQSIDEVELPVGDDPARHLDGAWMEMMHAAVVQHILNHTALSQQSKDVYIELVRTGDPCTEVAKRFGLKSSAVRQIKSRIDRMVKALEKRYLEC